MTGRFILMSLFAVSAFCLADAAAGEDAAARRKEAENQQRLGNFKNAAEMYRGLALDPANSPKDAAGDLRHAFDSLIKMDDPRAGDELLDQAAEAWPESWRVLAETVRLRGELPPLVAAVDGEFVRARYWGGNNKNAFERDRARSILALLQAEKRLDAPSDAATREEKAGFYRLFAGTVAKGRTDRAAWRFTALTGLDPLPDYEDYNAYYSAGERGAPVDADGNPVYYPLPASWDAAENDGQRWRWLLGRMAEYGEDGRAGLMFADFLLSQFGVQTMGRSVPAPRDGGGGADTGAFAVRTLSDDETIARLATGLKRFIPPAEFNHIRILRSLADNHRGHIRLGASERLANIYENRQQYHKAVSFWESIAPMVSSTDPKTRVDLAIERITGKNGMLEPGPVAPAGARTRIPYLFRNGEKVAMIAYRLDEQQLLRDIRAAVKAESEEFWQNPALQRPEQLGRIVVERDAEKYIAEKTAEWEVRLDPLPDYYSTRAYLEMPFDFAGCYLVEAKMAGGNTSRVVLWVADLALVRKPAYDKQIIYVADAVTGEPAAKANISFFGYNQSYQQNRRRPIVTTTEFAETADADGLALVDSERMTKNNWLITARTEDGKMAYLGFDSVWAEEPDRASPRDVAAFVITDRPVYRPEQDVNIKIWLGLATYGDYPSPYQAGRKLKVQIHNPMGDMIYDKTLTTDDHGGVADKLVLDANAPLGAYTIVTPDVNGYATFRLEEYKKPEYEVTVETPEKALILGDTARIKVKAKYYFGSPVANAKVNYKILRSVHRDRWLPPWRWDWLYGAGAWLQTYDYAWYPGWNDWSVPAPRPAWLPPVYAGQPELVAEGEGTLDEDGVFRLPLDTAPAKELYGDRDHKYDITVEVTDRSRRVIVGSGTVVAARKAFTATVWTDRGYYLVGQGMRVNLKTTRPLGGGVKTSGQAVLHRVTYDDDGVPHENTVEVWPIETDDQGAAEIRLSAGLPGQYRISCEVKDAEGNAVDGGAVVTVRGEKGEGDFRFAALELVADRQEYVPGDTVKLAVNSENKKAVVLLFPRAERGGKPTLLRLDTGSDVVDLKIDNQDRPNFFCEAVTVFGGKVHSETRQIFVPPAAKALTVEVKADRDNYLPGGKAVFEVRVADADGKPVSGQCAVSLYDKSVEYISGGSNVGDILAHFWSWKRYYNPRNIASLDRFGYRPMKKGDVSWEPIGIFGGQEADWNDDGVYVNGRLDGGNRGVGGASHVMRMARTRSGEVEVDMAMPMAVPPPAAAPMADMAVMQEAKMESAAYAGPAAATGGSGGEVQPQVRSEFADTALWLAVLDTDADGRAAFSLDMPENLTGWKARVWTMGPETRVGDGQTEVETRKNVIVRPQAPRFLTQKDQVVLSANLHNYLPRAKAVRAELVLEGGLLEPADGVELTRSLTLNAQGEARVDWLVDAKRPGEARIVMKLLTDEESDAAEITLPVIVHGARKVEPFGGVVRRNESETTIKFRVPAERLADKSRLELAVSPSIASAMLEALPFLIEYPYGCTEQTLNRFLPVVMTRKYLDGLGLTLSDAEKAAKDSRTDAKSAEWKDRFGDERARRRPSPVFDDNELAAMVRQGLERLAAMQNADGGWGWFSGAGERSWPHTTAVVVHGLLAAKKADTAVSADLLDAGVAWLRGYQERQIEKLKLYVATRDRTNYDGDRGKARADNLDAFVYMILAEQGRFNPDMRDFLYRDRLDLSLTGMAMLGIALHAEKAANFLDIVLQNLEQYLETDAENGAAWLRTPPSGWWWWYNDGIESQAWYLKLLSRTDPQGDRTSGLAKYLLQNRKNGAYWRSTRDTAYAIEALTEYAAASGEIKPDMTVTLFLDGKQVMERRLTAENLLGDHRFLLEGLAVEEGEHELRLVRSGGGNVYYSGGLDLFSLEDPIAKAGGDLKVDRAYYKLVREEKTASMRGATGTAAEARVEKYRRERIASPFDGGAGAKVLLEPGDLIEVELTVESKNDYEYLVFEDMKAAGCEAVELRSGYSANALGAYVEYRDQKVVLFVRHLPRGKYSLAYRFRAETPGYFSALPAFGGGMYATDLFANSDEMKVRIVEKGVFGE